MIHRRRLNAVVFCLIAALALVAGCAGGDDDDDTSSDDDDSGDDDGDNGDGDLIANLLRADPYPRLVIEVDYVEGFAPRDAATAAMTAYIATVIDKPAGVEIELDDVIVPPESGHAWTRDELAGLADTLFDEPTDGDAIRVHALYLDGSYEPPDDSGTLLGLAFSKRHLAMFMGTMEDDCHGGPRAFLPPSMQESICAKGEQHVLTHEVGHLLGLVNNGLAMVEDHEDSDHPHHDTERSCLMYWAYAGEGILETLTDRLTGGNTDDIAFDAACLADIAAVRDGN